MHHILEPSAPLAEALASHGQPAWREKAIRRWLYGTRAAAFSDMTDLPQALRGVLEEEFRIWTTTIATHSQADDGTEKLLLELHDGQRIECVLLRDGDRRTVCISSQVGCAMGCVFCASGIDGVVRNLTTGEIIEQLLRLARLLPAGERLSHVVVMGMGEPLANLDRLLPALALAQDPQGLGISQRRITVSTVGLPPAIDRLTAENPGYHLAVSLHAADDTLRTRLVPVNKAIGLAEVMAASDRYWEASGRRLTFEYVLLGGVNDSPTHARDLVRLLGGRAALVNIIPYNSVAGLPWREPSQGSRERFLDVLRVAGVNVQVRRRKGARIDAACGQLRRLALGAPRLAVEKAAVDPLFIDQQAIDQQASGT
ncbi:MAG: 23S rRNA (adenine(2503)-C(2))-methyltransferase RlmN [Planctomycetota bacterium]|nr:MAG: 23S rRNA (adenine(2503)-C(2))-methyltransferase RlmN [Planctomycetota bacterium]